MALVTPQRIGIAVIGVALLAAGIAAVFLTDNGPGSASLVALGALVVGVAVFSHRIESLEFGGAKLKLHALARQRLALASRREREGDIDTATRLRKQAIGFERLANAYARIRRLTPGGPSRTEVLDGIVLQASKLAQDTEFDPVDVWSWFDRGDERTRVIVLGLMQGDGQLLDFFAALDAIEHPWSPFECFHGLVVARQMIASLNDLESAWLKEAIVEAQRAERFRADGESMRVGEEILEALLA